MIFSQVLEYGSSGPFASGGQVVGFSFGGESMVKRIPCRIINSIALSEVMSGSCFSDGQQSVMPSCTDLAHADDGRSNDWHNFTSGRYRQFLARYSEPDDSAGRFIDCYI